MGREVNVAVTPKETGGDDLFPGPEADGLECLAGGNERSNGICFLLRLVETRKPDRFRAWSAGWRSPSMVWRDMGDPLRIASSGCQSSIVPFEDRIREDGQGLRGRRAIAELAAQDRQHGGRGEIDDLVASGKRIIRSWNRQGGERYVLESAIGHDEQRLAAEQLHGRCEDQLCQVAGRAIVALSLKPVGGPPGDATASQMDAVADLADRYSYGEIRVAHEQNLALPHVAQRDLPELWRALDAIGVATPNVGLISDIIACPGLDYCSLANARSIPVAEEITRRFRDADLARSLGRLHVNISGCINACGHHHVGHVGILGVEKNGREYYQVTIGGRAGEDAALGTILGPAVPYGEIADVVEDIAAAYLELRERPEELFIDTVARVGVEPFRERVHAAR